jgi:hypothetical protein
MAEAPQPPREPFRHWYANAVPLYVRGKWLVIYTEVESLVTAVTLGRSFHTTLPMFQARAPALLHRLGFPEAWIATFRQAMANVTVARAVDRGILGSMTDFRFQARYMTDGLSTISNADLDAIEDRLCIMPMKRIGMQSPEEVATAVVARDVALHNIRAGANGAHS